MLEKFLYLITPRAYAQQSILGDFRSLVCPGATTHQKTIDCLTQLNLNDTIVMVNVIVRIALGLAGIITLIFLIYAGYLYMTSLGNPDSIAKAKNKLLYTSLGLLLIIIAYALVVFILNLVGNPLNS